MGSSDPKLHIVVTCTERKTAQVPTGLRLRNIPDGTPEARAQAWIARLIAEESALPVRALDLYAGEHWRVAKTLPSLAAVGDAHLWICSAGYGLISGQTAVRPYSATVSPGHRDSVTGGRTGTAAWWRSIASWEGPKPGEPRTIAELAESDRDATYVLVLSAAYLQACSTDIEAAAEAVADKDRFIIVSSGTRATGPLAQVLVPTDARLQTHFGGTRQVLNVRIAADLLARQLTSRAAATSYLVGLLESSPGIKRYDRKKLSDDEIMSWIRDSLPHMAGSSASSMLRVFRDAGYACEQHRFGELYRNISGGHA